MTAVHAIYGCQPANYLGLDFSGYRGCIWVKEILVQCSRPLSRSPGNPGRGWIHMGEEARIIQMPGTVQGNLGKALQGSTGS